jgi:hypothetical protein
LTRVRGAIASIQVTVKLCKHIGWIALQLFEHLRRSRNERAIPYPCKMEM